MSSLTLSTPNAFLAFPYDPPYPIQVDLMKHIYDAIEHARVAIVESPTGTGKTLSLLCASLTWLLDEKQRAKKGKLDSIQVADGTPDWVAEQTRLRLVREIEADEQEVQERLLAARKREESLLRMSRARARKRPRLAEPVVKEAALDEDAFLPDEDIESEDNISPSVRALMNKLEGNGKNRRWDETSDVPHTTKIYYASRTHSQLSQVVPELRRLKLHTTISSINEHSTASCGKRPAEDAIDDSGGVLLPPTVALGSRKQLCINEDLKRSRGDLDDKCRDLLEEKGSKRCPHLPPPDEDAKMIQLRDQVLATPKDIEELAEAGSATGTCPYFGSRQAIPQAELVTLPYNLLLHKGSREALGIDLRGQVVIIDEAHNLISTLLSVTSVRVTSNALNSAFAQVCHYVAKFRTRLLAYHMLHLKRLVTFMKSLKEYLAEWENSMHKSKTRTKTETMTSAELLTRVGKNVAGFNFLEIEAYLRKSKIAKKISKYNDACNSDTKSQTDKTHKAPTSTLPPLQNVESLIVALVAANDDGCVTLSSTSDGVEIKYQPLNPAPPFMEVIEASRAVILAGGTMSPMSDIIGQLFYAVNKDRISTFSCGHIMPKSNLLAVAIGSGPSGADLDYRAEQQQNEKVVADLGHVLVNLCRILPAGTVVFFPSYSFLARARALWDKNGTISRLAQRKQIFYEPEESTQVESTLREYGDVIASKDTSTTNGALLFAVIGAKLSEGLNFSDDLARAVIIIGLPFPNLGSSELQERMKFVRRKLNTGGKDAGAELYENICMNSVNQSIGRAIRHQNDWAALIFLDRRYRNGAITNKLSKWIQPHYQAPDSFGKGVKMLSTFYQSHK